MESNQSYYAFILADIFSQGCALTFALSSQARD